MLAALCDVCAPSFPMVLSTCATVLGDSPRIISIEPGVRLSRFCQLRTEAVVSPSASFRGNVTRKYRAWRHAVACPYVFQLFVLYDAQLVFEAPLSIDVLAYVIGTRNWSSSVSGASLRNQSTCCCCRGRRCALFIPFHHLILLRRERASPK